jgi:hypothetical protein
MPKSPKTKNYKSSKTKKNIKKSIKKNIKKSKSKFTDDPIGHRKSLYGQQFTDCYDKFTKLKHDSKSGHPTLEAHRKAVKYLEKHLPKCIEIIGNYIIDH